MPGTLCPSHSTPRSVLERLRDRPAAFQRLILGRELWAKQIDVCNAVARSPITVVPAGRAVGKSFLLAGLVLWWLYTRRHSRVITTGPDHRQVVSVLWGELRKALRESRVPLGHDLLTEGYGSPQRLCVRHGTRWEALGFAAQHPEGFSGQHAPEQLVIVDEASGIRSEIWDAIHGLCAARLVVAGNPIRFDCHFRELHELAPGSRTIDSIPISSLEHPDAQLEQSQIGAVSRMFLEQQREIHGEESPWWRSNILGLFPAEESVRFIPTAWLDACTRDVSGDDLWRDAPAGSAWMGVDVAGGVGADRSVVVVRNRKQVLEVFASEWHGVLDDARHRLEPVVASMARRWQVPGDHIIYDKAGVGRSFGSYLERWTRREQREWLEAHADQPPDYRQRLQPSVIEGAVGYFGAGKGGKLYLNRRTACAFALKRRLDPHREGHVPLCCAGLPEWPRLREELAALHGPTMEMEEGEVKQVLEDKATLMQRLKRSPDLLDALLMTFAFSEG